MFNKVSNAALLRSIRLLGLIIGAVFTALGVLSFTHVGVAQATPSGAIRSTAARAAALGVVRQFLAARREGNRDAAYACLSARSRHNISEQELSDGSPLPLDAARKIPASVFGLMALLNDWHHTLHFTFTLIGVDPTDLNVVLVRANPPSGAVGLHTATLRLLTVTDRAARARRLDALGSLERAAPGVMARVYEYARRDLSQSHLRQLSLAVTQYGQDHDEIMPDAVHWVDEIMPYVKSKAIFHDPSAPASETWSYAYNRALSHNSLASISDPASTVVLFESIKGGKNASDTGKSVPQPGRHMGGTDYAFADGHVEWYPDGSLLLYNIPGD
jgi:prepilin-type processing-associated H-X9-DG protein